MLTFIERLRAYDEDTIESLDSLLSNELGSACEFLLNSGRREDVSLSAAVYRSIVMSLGRNTFEQQLRTRWSEYPEYARCNVVYCVADPEGPSIELSRFIFEHETATVEEKHLVVAGLSSTAKQRKCHAELIEMLDHIGTYAEPEKQKILDRFITSIRETFAHF